MTTYVIVEPDGDGWQIATIGGVECRGLTLKSHPAILRRAWISAENPPAHLVGMIVCTEARPEPAVSIGEVAGDPPPSPTSIDIESKVATYQRPAVSLPETQFKAAWAFERDRLIARVKADAEAARMRFLTAGSGKALTYEAKRREVARWMVEVSGDTNEAPATAADYPFANAEASARQSAVEDRQYRAGRRLRSR